MNNLRAKLQTLVWLLLCTIVGTIPLLFGAVHPIVLGSYVFLILVVLGGWLVFTAEPGELCIGNFWSIVPLILIVWLVIQALPLPLSWVEIISPQRADRIIKVNELAGIDIRFLPLSENGPVGLYRSFLLLALLVLYYSVRSMIRQNRRVFRWLLYSMIGVGLIEAIYGLMQFINPSIGMLWLDIPGRAAHGTIIYKNQFASLLNMIWPLAVAGFAAHFAGRSEEKGGQQLSRKMRMQRRFLSVSRTEAILFFAATVPMLLAVLFSLSRGGILAMTLVALLLIVLLPFTVKKKIIFVALFLAVLGGYGSLLGLDTIVSRFGSIGGSGGTRLELYLASLPILFDHWLAGIGLESYTLLSPVYLKGFPANIHFDRAHNEYLELTLELGIPMAILLFCWLVAGLIRVAGKLRTPALRSAEERSRCIVVVAAFCGVIGFLAHGLVDFGWRLPANLVYAVTLLAMIDAAATPEKKGTDEPVTFFSPEKRGETP
ncbi:MAG: O-antigen ligase family protein [Desulfobulbaceae bacterium]|nr:O-antigen ligase family protein [Desulfobulbaceae bacterium]